MNTNPHEDEDERLAGDLLVGAEAIREFLAFLGMSKKVDPYYLRRTGNWPIGKTAGNGGNLIASKRKLARHAQKITNPQKSDAA